MFSFISFILPIICIKLFSIYSLHYSDNLLLIYLSIIKLKLDNYLFQITLEIMHRIA